MVFFSCSGPSAKLLSAAPITICVSEVDSRRVQNGSHLARRGVVVVTINYRLGCFGLFSHPALTRESPHRASGNQGLLDQVAALVPAIIGNGARNFKPGAAPPTDLEALIVQEYGPLASRVRLLSPRELKRAQKCDELLSFRGIQFQAELMPADCSRLGPRRAPATRYMCLLQSGRVKHLFQACRRSIV